jgi:hypothetical protein
LYPAHTQVEIELNQADLIGDGIGAFDVKAHGQPTARPCQLDVTHRSHQNELRSSLCQPIAQAGNHSHVLFDTVVAEADVQ